MIYQGSYDPNMNQSKVIFGENSLMNLPDELKGLGEKVLLITGNTINKKTGLVEKISNLLGSGLVTVFAETKPHTPRKTILEAAGLARSIRPDCLISLGGGSATDTAKAVKLALWTDIFDEGDFDQVHNRMRSHKGRNVTGPLIPQISLPTTLVGAEYSSGIGITNEATSTKQVFRHPSLQCRAIILDPALTLYTPPVLWLSTGIKSLEHTIASITALERHPIAEAAGSLAVQIIKKELVRSFNNPENIEARGQLQVGGWLSKLASGESLGMRMGLSHALGRQIGSVCGVPHGLSSCVILPFAIEYNSPVSIAGLIIVAQALGINTDGLRGEKTGHAAAEAIRSLVSRLGLPARLRDIGVQKNDLRLISERTMGDWSTGSNPRPVAGAGEILGLLEKAW